MSSFPQGRRFAGAFMALVLLLGGCGEGEIEHSQVAAPPTAEKEPEPEPEPDAEPEPSPQAAPAPAPPPPPPAPAPPPPPAPAPPPPPAAPQSATGPAAPGEYVFDESGVIGTEGCLIANQPPPTPTRLNVGASEGARQQIDRDQTGAGSVGSRSSTVLEYREDGAYLVSLRQEQTVNAQTLVLDFQATGAPQRIIPAFPQVGDTGSFSLTSADRQVRVDAGITVEQVGESIALGEGAVLQAVRIRTTSQVGGVSPQGSLNLSVTRTSWYSPEKRLEIREITETTGTVGLCRVNSRVESLARAL